MEKISEELLDYVSLLTSAIKQEKGEKYEKR